jgi:hypothetical protein
MRNPLLLLAFLSLAGCSSVDDTVVNTISCGDFASFRPVSDVLERRCGTIDCHGTFSRPLRLYGPYGQRRLEDAGAVEAGIVMNYDKYYPGGSAAEPTTSLELLDNYRSVCGLEPELMNRVITLQAAPEELTLVRKARLMEKHKGGQVFNPGREGDVCLTTWLTQAATPDAGIDKTACAAEINHP